MFLSKIFIKEKINKKNIKNWLKLVCSKSIPGNIKALNFNLYDDGDYNWTIELIGSDYFDIKDSDWACNNTYVDNDDYRFKVNTDWETILKDTTNVIEEFVNKNKLLFERFDAIGIGFVEGDLYYIKIK